MSNGRRYGGWVLGCTVLLVWGCGDAETVRSGAEPAAEPAPAERPVAPEVTGYAPQSLAWYREGRPVEFAGREWIPVGQPLHGSPSDFRRVGAFEAMDLYATRGESRPFDVVFFPLGNGIWQPLTALDPVRPLDPEGE